MRASFSFDSVVADAVAAEGVEDFGPDGAWQEPLGVLLDSYAAAPLNDLGVHILRGGIVHALAMRLRAIEWRRRHPEIDEEVIERPVVVVGMMRSGTTLVQRLLAADDRSHCVLGWEVGESAPPLDADGLGDVPRIARAEAREEQTRTFAPDLFAIHPMYAHEAEEEIMFLADAFLSHVPEASADVPDYRAWIDTRSFEPAYRHLRRTLQLLQWQKRRRGEVRHRWVLKTPAHLGYLDDLLSVFPDVHVVHLHRDPVATIPSGASLNTTLWRMHADNVDPARVGAQWIERMGWTNDRAMAARDRLGASLPVTDLEFSATVADPMSVVRRIYDETGVELTEAAVTRMESWRRRDRARTLPSHRYTASDFGLSQDQIRERFAVYVERFLPETSDR